MRPNSAEDDIGKVWLRRSADAIHKYRRRSDRTTLLLKILSTERPNYTVNQKYGRGSDRSTLGFDEHRSVAGNAEMPKPMEIIQLGKVNPKVNATRFFPDHGRLSH